MTTRQGAHEILDIDRPPSANAPPFINTNSATLRGHLLPSLHNVVSPATPIHTLGRGAGQFPSPSSENGVVELSNTGNIGESVTKSRADGEAPNVIATLIKKQHTPVVVSTIHRKENWKDNLSPPRLGGGGSVGGANIVSGGGGGGFVGTIRALGTLNSRKILPMAPAALNSGARNLNLAPVNSSIAGAKIERSNLNMNLPNPPASLQRTLRQQRQQQIQQQLIAQAQAEHEEEERRRILTDAVPPALRDPPQKSNTAQQASNQTRPDSGGAGGGGKLRVRLMETLAAGANQTVEHSDQDHHLARRTTPLVRIFENPLRAENHTENMNNGDYNDDNVHREDSTVQRAGVHQTLSAARASKTSHTSTHVQDDPRTTSLRNQSSYGNNEQNDEDDEDIVVGGQGSIHVKNGSLTVHRNEGQINGEADSNFNKKNFDKTQDPKIVGRGDNARTPTPPASIQASGVRGSRYGSEHADRYSSQRNEDYVGRGDEEMNPYNNEVTQALLTGIQEAAVYSPATNTHANADATNKLRMAPHDLAKARQHTPRSAHQTQVIEAVRGGVLGETNDSSSANDTPSTFATSVNTNQTVTTPAADAPVSGGDQQSFVSPRRAGGSASRRPRSAHQDYENYVRGITGGHYLKERYSDHIQVSTQMVLGRGSYGIVYSGVNEKTGQMVAVKHIEIDAKREILNFGGASGDTAEEEGKKSRPVSASPSHKEILRAAQVDECLKDVVTEIRLMAQLKHPNIVQYYHAELVGPRWEDIHERRRRYLTQQRRRVQRYERKMMMDKEKSTGAMSPLSPLLQKDADSVLPPMEPPQSDLTAPPSPMGRRYLVIYMEYMSGGSLASLMTKILGDKNMKAREAIMEQRAREQEEKRKRDEAAGIPPPTKKEKQPPIIIPPRVVAFSEQMIRVYFKQVLDGLAYLHDHNIVHRDIKADNLLLSASDGVVRISDFGTSRKFSDVSALGVGNDEDGGGGPRALMTIIGTPHFMAPEVITKAGHGFPADIWSVGVTIIQLLTGQAPYETGGNEFAIMFKIANEPEKIQEFIPDDASIMMKDFILKCVAPQPEDRWTAHQLLVHPFLQDQVDGYYTSESEEEGEESEDTAGEGDEYEPV